MKIRYAERTDCVLILQFIKELADYEKMLSEVVATPEILEEWIFDKQKAEVIFAMIFLPFRLFLCIFAFFMIKATNVAEIHL